MDNAKSIAAGDANKAGAAVGLPAGTKIGKYEVRERLAIGGQALIYKGYDSLLDRFVAIKQISSHLAGDANFLDRFRKEAQILARLGTHQPAIVTIYELIEDERGLFIVMEHISGQTIEANLEESDQPMDPKVVLQILWRLAAALKDVHAAGIIHRDIKPGNIIITEGLRPKITDFGVAASLTGQTSMLLGTTKYMAPELVNGEGFDGRADMYSLGFIIYEMLLGRAKFNEVFAEVVRDKHSEAMRWMKWHGNDSVQAPRVNELNPAVSQALSDIVARMLAKNVADRYENMEALGQAIKAAASAVTTTVALEAPHMKHKHQPEVKDALSTPSPTGADKTKTAPSVKDGQAISQEQGPATVALPKKRMTPKRKVILASILAVAVIATVTALAIHSGYGRDAIARQAKKIYNTAEEAYKKDDYKTAADNYDRLMKGYPTTDEAAKASVMLQLAQGYLAIEARDWNKAADKEKAARDQQRVVNSSAKGDLYKWSQDIDGQLREFGARRTNTRDFVATVTKAQDDMKAGDFAKARNDLSLSSMTSLTASQKEELAALKILINKTEFRHEFELASQKGDAARTAGDFATAEKIYSEALDKLIAPTTPKVLDNNEFKKIEANFNEKIKAIQTEKSLTELKMVIEDSHRNNNYRQELAAIEQGLQIVQEQGLKIAQVEEWSKRLPQLKAMVALSDGQQALSDGKLGAARDKFVESKRLFDNPEADKALKNLEQIELRNSLISAGQAAFAAGNFADATKKFTEALPLPAQPKPPLTADALKDKIRECQYQAGLAEANKFCEQRKYDDAIKKCEGLRPLTVDPTAIDALLAKIKTEQDYENYLSEGNRALANQEWSKAVQQYKLAKGKKDTDEVRQFLNITSYRQNLALGKAGLEAGEYVSAIAYLKLAQQYVPQAEKKQLEELIRQAEEKQKANP